MPNLYFVDPFKQPSQMACMFTVVNMLQRWNLNRIGLSHIPTEFENLVGSGAGKDISGTDVSDAVKMVKEQRWGSRIINATPPAFEEQLHKNGPFVYIEKLGLNIPASLLFEALSGHQWMHAHLITGLTDKHKVPHVIYNDPGLGKSQSMDFSKFLKLHPPFEEVAHTFIIFIPQ